MQAQEDKIPFIEDLLLEKIESAISKDNPEEGSKEFGQIQDWLLKQNAIELFPKFFYERGLYYYRVGYYRLSNNSYLQLLRIKETDVSLALRSSVHNNMGINYNIMGLIDSALSAFQKSAEIDKLLNDTEGLNKVMLNIGYLYIQTSQIDQGIEMTKNVLNFFENRKDTLHIILCNQNLCIASRRLDKQDEACRYLDEAIRLAEAAQNTDAMFQLYVNRALDYTDNEEWELAYHYYLKANQLDKVLPTTEARGLLKLIYGSFLMHHKRFSEARIEFEEALRIYSLYQIESRIPHALRLITESCAYLNDLDCFSENFDAYVRAIAGNHHAQMESQLSELMLIHNVSLKDAQIITNRNLYEKSARNFYLMLIAAIFIVIGMIILFLYHFKLKRSYRAIFEQNVKTLTSDHSFTNEIELVEIQKEEIVEKKKFVIEDSPNEILTRFIRHLREKELYKNIDLTLSSAASAIGTNERYLSNAINSTGKENFNSLVNQFRIQEAKRLMLIAPDEEIKINDLFMAVGFKNRQTFFRAFKQFTGLSPSLFIKEVTQTEKEIVDA